MDKGILAFLLVFLIGLTACGGESDSSIGGESDSSIGDNNNSTPISESQSVILNEDEAKSIILSGSDPDGDGLSYTIVNQPSHGTLSGAVPDLTYIPTGDYYGNDSFSFKVNDGHQDSTEGTLTLTITPVNDAPSADDLTVKLEKNSSKNITLSGMDVEGDAISFTVQASPQNGNLSGTAPNLTYTPNHAYMGSDSFSYIVNDGEQDSLVATVSVTVHAIVTYQMPLNDTGITTCIDGTVSEQDCAYGRDVTHNDDSDGHAGFSFTKLDANGDDLPASATNWSCVRDNVTKLIWENKVKGNGISADGGLHDADDTYSWYNLDSSSNGGFEGYENKFYSTCDGHYSGNRESYCNTQAYVQRVNQTKLCGTYGWRLPNKMELRSLVNHNQGSPAIDTTYFPNTKGEYWSSSPAAESIIFTWAVLFYNGESSLNIRSYPIHVRLVSTVK